MVSVISQARYRFIRVVWLCETFTGGHARAPGKALRRAVQARLMLSLLNTAGWLGQSGDFRRDFSRATGEERVNFLGGYIGALGDAS